VKECKILYRGNFRYDNQYQLRYTGGMVPDVNQIMVKGKGVFVNAESKAAKAKLRLLYEVTSTLIFILRVPERNVIICRRLRQSDTSSRRQAESPPMESSPFLTLKLLALKTAPRLHTVLLLKLIASSKWWERSTFKRTCARKPSGRVRHISI